jgi:L-seryl-tRNA(Ser) seleniumtransferase
MLAITTDAIEGRAKNFIAKLAKSSESNALTATIVAGLSAVGGGSGPNVHPPTALIAVKHAQLNAAEIEQKLRLFSPPVIARIADDQVLIDLRTVDDVDEPELLAALRSLGP